MAGEVVGAEAAHIRCVTSVVALVKRINAPCNVAFQDKRHFPGGRHRQFREAAKGDAPFVAVDRVSQHERDFTSRSYPSAKAGHFTIPLYGIARGGGLHRLDRLAGNSLGHGPRVRPVPVTRANVRHVSVNRRQSNIRRS
jgi:hypothetical protein